MVLLAPLITPRFALVPTYPAGLSARCAAELSRTGSRRRRKRRRSRRQRSGLQAIRPLLCSEVDVAPPADVRAEHGASEVVSGDDVVPIHINITRGNRTVPDAPIDLSGKSAIDVIGAGEMTAEVAPLKPAAHEPRRWLCPLERACAGVWCDTWADGPFEARSAVTGPGTRIWPGGSNRRLRPGDS